MSRKPWAAWLGAAGSLLVSQFAFADGTSAPPPQPADAPLEVAAAPANAHCVPAWVIDAAGIQQLPDHCLANDATDEIALPDSDAGCEPPWFIDATGIRRVRQECLRGTAQPAPAAPVGGAAAKRSPAPAASRSQSDGCEQPFWVDQHGIQRLKMRCLGAATAAEPDADGSASTPVSVQKTEEAETCAQPFWVDQHGIRRLKMRCL